MRPNFMAVGGYDGMRVIYEALKNTKGGKGGGDALLAAMKGQILRARADKYSLTRKPAISCKTFT